MKIMTIPNPRLIHLQPPYLTPRKQRVSGATGGMLKQWAKLRPLK